jgi:hypothetical protein
MVNSITLTVLENGKLRIALNDGAADELADYAANHGEMDTLWEVGESYWCNGWGVMGADDLCQLSECPVVSEDCTIEDDGGHTLSGRAWYFPDYAVTDIFGEILKNGYIDFDLWENFGNHPEYFSNPYNV